MFTKNVTHLCIPSYKYMFYFIFVIFQLQNALQSKIHDIVRSLSSLSILMNEITMIQECDVLGLYSANHSLSKLKNIFLFSPLWYKVSESPFLP